MLSTVNGYKRVTDSYSIATTASPQNQVVWGSANLILCPTAGCCYLV